MTALVDTMKTDEWIKLRERLENLARPSTDRPYDEFPTVRDLARKLRVRQKDILDLVQDSENLDTLVGIRAGNGVGRFDLVGDYQVEWISDTENV